MTRSSTPARSRLTQLGGVATASAALVASCLGAGTANAAVSSGALDCDQALIEVPRGHVVQGWDGIQKDPNTYTVAEVEAMEADFQARLAELGAAPDVAEPIEVQVYYHVVRADRTVEGGNVPRSWLRQQNKYLNHSFRGKGHSEPGARTPFTFAMTDVDRTTNQEWFDNAEQADVELEMKTALRAPGSTAETLNIYLTNLVNVGLLGYAYLPSDYDEVGVLDGLVVESQSLPGGSAAPYDLGGTVVHEAGHWVGLYHTFQGGCDGPKGDRVEDTPKMSEPTSGCPEGKDTCEADGLDPIHNYMDYSDDACYNQFTIGQRDRSKDQWYAYREGVS